MEKRRSINTKFWDDTWISALSKDEKLLYLYLLTSPLTNLLGIYEITLKRISYDTGISQDEILNHLKSFEEVKKALFFKDWVIIFNHLKNQAFNSNMKKGANEIFNNLPNFLKYKLKENGIESFETLSNGLGMVREYEREEEREEEEECEKSHPLQKMIKTEPLLKPLLKIKTQLTFEQAEILEAKYSNDLIITKIKAIANKADIEKSYSSVYLTIDSWCSKK